MRAAPLLGLLLGGGCPPAGSTPLEALSEPAVPFLLEVAADARVDYAPLSGYRLVLDLDISWSGQTHPRLNLASALVRADGGTWESCRHVGDPPEELILVLEPGEHLRRTVACADIPRPDERLDFRFTVAGTGEKGVVDLSFDGLRAARRPEPR